MQVCVYNKNKKGELEIRGKVWISFCIIPVAQAKLSPVGLGRDKPNLDPFLPEPAGRISFFTGMLNGFLCVCGTLKDWLFNILMIVCAIAVIGYSL